MGFFYPAKWDYFHQRRFPQARRLFREKVLFVPSRPWGPLWKKYLAPRVERMNETRAQVYWKGVTERREEEAAERPFEAVSQAPRVRGHRNEGCESLRSSTSPLWSTKWVRLRATNFHKVNRRSPLPAVGSGSPKETIYNFPDHPWRFPHDRGPIPC